jgi:hypothetical protein
MTAVLDRVRRTATERRGRSPALAAASCPGCRLPIVFDPAELTADEPAAAAVMCSFCSTVTSRDRLAEAAWVVGESRARSSLKRASRAVARAAWPTPEDGVHFHRGPSGHPIPCYRSDCERRPRLSVSDSAG